MSEHRILLRGGQILSLDPDTPPAGDILIEGDKIVAVGADLLISDAEVIDVSGHIVMPGMIDTHRHTWQTQMRAICGDWTLTDYFYGIRLGVSPAYTADDVSLGNRLGAVEALNAGVTTLLDFSHCMNTPDHADAAVDGLRAAGGRAVFGYGFFNSSPLAPQHFTEHHQRISDFNRIADAYFSSPGGLITLGASLNEYGFVPFSHTRDEITAAREHDALIVAHLGVVWSMQSGFTEMADSGLFGPDQVQVHCNTLTDNEFRLLADSGVKVSISPETELNMGMGRPVFTQCERHGIKPTLSCDVMSLNSGDLITQMRLGLGFKRWADTEPLNLAGEDPSKVSATTTQALEWCTINSADAIGMADTLGTISVGKQADLVVVGGPALRQHPIIHPAATVVFQTEPDDIVHVFVAGHAVKRDGQMVGVDIAELSRQAERSAEQILGRVAAELPGTPPDAAALVNAMVDYNLRS
ncbi:MAG: 5-methylthioadenosine/S-adenosylhomocysteine deaminase [Mycobacterium sp.]|jgi:cytosine/adenosine deaminase-related metal-dependent hydrolase|nr:5-methylthioadenosine/S-adenosylhomocysteine deaminase [Mycobacterium sp.]